MSSFAWHFIMAGYIIIASLFNKAYDTPHEPESRPNYAEVCWSDNRLTMWIEIRSYMVCDGGGKILYRTTMAPKVSPEGWTWEWEPHNEKWMWVNRTGIPSHSEEVYDVGPHNYPVQEK